MKSGIVESEPIDTEKFEEYTCDGEVFSVEDAAKHFGVTKTVIRRTARKLGYSHETAKFMESL